MWKYYQVNNYYISSNFLYTCYDWYQESAGILKANWAFEEDRQQFIKDLKKGMNFVGLEDDIFVAMVHGEEKEPDVIEGHLFAKPGTNKDFLAALITFSKHEALKRYKTVLTQTPSRHKGMLDLNYRAGFLDTGIRSWNCVYKNQLVEVQHNIAV